MNTSYYSMTFDVKVYSRDQVNHLVNELNKPGSTIKSFKLQVDNLTPDQQVAIGEALGKNKSVVTCSIEGNFSNTGMLAICKGLEKNKKLEKIYVNLITEGNAPSQQEVDEYQSARKRQKLTETETFWGDALIEALRENSSLKTVYIKPYDDSYFGFEPFSNTKTLDSLVTAVKENKKSALCEFNAVDFMRRASENADNDLKKVLEEHKKRDLLKKVEGLPEGERDRALQGKNPKDLNLDELNKLVEKMKL